MIRRDLLWLQNFDLPAGFRFKTFQKGDEVAWAEIETAAGEFDCVESALNRFQSGFGEHFDELEDRMFFIEDKNSRLIATGTAWYDNSFLGEPYGRVHWIAVHPDFQGRGLAKPLLSHVMCQLAKSHDKAYLITLTTSLRAIKIYLDFGFVPLATTKQEQKAWSMLAESLSHPALNEFR
jgi:ribosomal protein S18 acetylase RimI-like enzyme